MAHLVTTIVGSLKHPESMSRRRTRKTKPATKKLNGI
jgi:hypothetical protein